MEVYKGSDADVRAVIAITSLLESLSTKKNKILFIIPGGSAARVAESVLDNLSNDIRSKLTITLSDERFGPTGHQDSNWNLLDNLSVSLNDTTLLPVLKNLSTMSETARQWSVNLQQAFKDADSVVALFGIGDDNHIAGIKPSSPAAIETSELVSAYTWRDFERITLGPVVFKMITHAFIYTEGAHKQAAVDLLSQTKDFHEFPAQLVKRCGSTVVYYKS